MISTCESTAHVQRLMDTRGLLSRQLAEKNN